MFYPEDDCSDVDDFLLPHGPPLSSSSSFPSSASPFNQASHAKHLSPSSSSLSSALSSSLFSSSSPSESLGDSPSRPPPGEKNKKRGDHEGHPVDDEESLSLTAKGARHPDPPQASGLSSSSSSLGTKTSPTSSKYDEGGEHKKRKAL